MKKVNWDSGVWTPLRIVLVYTLFGGLWIFFSDRVLLSLSADPNLLSRLQTYKGWFFITGTSLLLFWLISRMTMEGLQTIDELRQTEAALRLSEEKFAKTFRNSPDAIALTSLADGQFVEVNESFLRLSGYRLDEIIGRTNLDLDFWVHYADRQHYLDLLRKHGRATAMETNFRKKSGEIMASLVSGEVIDLQGNSFILTVILDITERKQAEEVERERHRLEEQIAGIVQTAPGAICAFRLRPDGATSLPFVSPKWEEYYQLTQAEVRLDASLFYQRIHPDDTAHVQQSIQESARTMLPWRNDFRIINPAGGQRWVEGHSTPVLEADGSILWNCFVTDISDRKELEKELAQYRTHLEELVTSRTSELERSHLALQNLLEDVNETKMALEAANAKLQELDQLKSMFIASMSHELRTPLNSIIGFTGLMLQEMSGAINDEQRDHLERVYRAGKHLLALITDVIDIAKIESGKIVPHAEDFVLTAVIDEACDSLKVQMADKGLELVKMVPAAPIPMHNDRRRLLQCLLNFLSNAVKFSESGTVTVKAEMTEAEGVNFVEIAVSDTGVGIKQEDMGRLFHSFVRLESSLKIIVPGTGLGLYLTKKLATEVLGGSVAAESREGEGSTFRLMVPIVIGAEAEVTEGKEV